MNLSLSDLNTRTLFTVTFPPPSAAPCVFTNVSLTDPDVIFCEAGAIRRFSRADQGGSTLHSIKERVVSCMFIACCSMS